ncbi:MAG: hypothetical protein VX583_05530 [Bdellovibrionota bacterium]
MFIIIKFIGIISGLSFALFLGLRGYLVVSNSIKEPVTSIDQVKIGIAWILISIFVILIEVLGIKSVTFVGLEINRAIGIIPVVIGFLSSIFLYKEDWKSFSKKYKKSEKY